MVQRAPVLHPSHNAVTRTSREESLLDNLHTSDPGTDTFLPLGLSTAHIRPQAYKAQGLQPHIRPQTSQTCQVARRETQKAASSTLHIRPHPSEHTEPLRTEWKSKAAIRDSDKGSAHLSYAVGGSVSSLSFEDHGVRDQLHAHIEHPGGVRGKVNGFSRGSRRNLLRHLASIDRRAFRSFKGQLTSVTLTYPHEYPEDPRICQGHLKAFRKRLERKYGVFAAFWRMGIQNRGAFHFHLLPSHPAGASTSAGPGERSRFPHFNGTR